MNVLKPSANPSGWGKSFLWLALGVACFHAAYGEILSAQLRLPMRGSLPLDRFLAPVCVGVTGIVTAVLLFLNWKDQRAKPKS
jgi:hypothetical protein